MFKKKNPNTIRQRKPTDNTQDRGGADLSYYAHRSDQSLNTGRQQNRSEPKKSTSLRPRWRQRVGLLTLMVAIAVSAVYVISLSSSAKIVQLGTNDIGFLHSQSTYQAAADKILAGSIWNRNKLTVNTSNVAKQLTKQFPELSNVSVTLPVLTHRPIIYIAPAQPALVLTSKAGSYVIDSSGRALLEIKDPNQLINLSLPLVTDQSGLTLAVNQQAISSNDVSFIQTVVAQLAAKQVVVTSLTLPVASRELDAGISTQAYIVKFNLQSDTARQQAGTFLAAKARLSSENITPAHYIDVRVPGRAYYQ